MPGLRHTLVGTVFVAVAQLGCGSAPPVLVDPGPALPPEAGLHLVYRPAAVAELVSALEARSPEAAQSLRRSLIGRLLDAPVLRGMGLWREGLVGVSVQLGPELSTRRAAEDLERMLGAPERLEAWLAESLPPAVLHLRLAGSAVPPDLEALGGRLGALQVVEPSDGLAALAMAVEAPEAQLEGAPEALYVRLLDTALPTLFVIRRAGPRRVVDVLMDEGLATGALAQALRSLPPLDGGRALELRRAADLLRLELDPSRWRRFVGLMGEVGALRIALAGGPDLARRVQLLRRRTAAAEAVFERAGTRQGRSTLRLGMRERRLHLELEGPLEGESRPALMPVQHAALAEARLALSVAGPEAWPEAKAVDLGRTLGEALGCGVPCLPALWLALPHLGASLPKLLAGLFPSLASLGAPLEGVRAANLYMDDEGVALALRLGSMSGGVRASLEAALTNFAPRWRKAEPVLVLGPSAATVERLAGKAPARRAQGELLRLDARPTAALSAVLEEVNLRVQLGAGVLRLSAEASLRKLVSPPTE